MDIPNDEGWEEEERRGSTGNNFRSERCRYWNAFMATMLTVAFSKVETSATHIPNHFWFAQTCLTDTKKSIILTGIIVVK